MQNNNASGKKVKLLEGFPWETIAVFLGGIQILRKRFFSEEKFPGTQKNIIAAIHEKRFSDREKYVITGGHFSDLYVRNLGIFYADLLDNAVAKSDLQKRQAIGIKTLTLDLQLLEQAKREPTTFTKLFGNFYMAKNIYARASDSLYAILYTLEKLQENRATKHIAEKLLEKYHKTLARLIAQYVADVFDTHTGILKKNVYLASARDGVKRESSFYDNVIFWATLTLAKKMQLTNQSQDFLNTLRKKILTTFWDTKEKIFLDDLSAHAQKQHTFCADSFIVLATGFLDIKNAADKKKLANMVAYVEKNKLDQPFPIHYTKENTKHNLHFWVRHMAMSYMGESIWSHWGMEYIKALILLDKKAKAKKFLKIYEQNIEKYGGYPELYDTDGNIFRTFFYKSVLHTGWVINFEKTLSLANS